MTHKRFITDLIISLRLIKIIQHMYVSTNICAQINSLATHTFYTSLKLY